MDYEGNEDRISQIDSQLEALGVETISYAEVQSKVGTDLLPMATVGSTSTTRWTSRRVVVTYNGQHYELQILEGEPTSGSSPLRRNYSNINYEADGIGIGVLNAAKVLAVDALGCEALVGPYLAAGVNFLSLLHDMGHEIWDSLSTSTTIDKVTGVAMVSVTVHMRYILVKPYQTPDYGNQATCYIGNQASYILTTVSSVDVTDGDNLYTYHDVETSVSDSSTSAYYDDFSLAARNYHNYKYNGITNYTDNFCMQSMTVSIFNVNRELNIPSEMPQITG